VWGRQVYSTNFRDPTYISRHQLPLSSIRQHSRGK
jgi:hypothetical protein